MGLEMHIMARNSEPNEITAIFKGLLLLLLCHVLAGVFIFVIGLIIGLIFAHYTFLLIWMGGAMGFLFWQLLYVIPLTIRLRRRGEINMMKGVIIGAVITALVNGACFLATKQ
jgi:hypothetical protein